MFLDVSVCPHTETITISVRGLTEISTTEAGIRFFKKSLK